MSSLHADGNRNKFNYFFRFSATPSRYSLRGCLTLLFPPAFVPSIPGRKKCSHNDENECRLYSECAEYFLCVTSFYLNRPSLQIVFIFTQMYFIFLNQKMNVYKHKADTINVLLLSVLHVSSPSNYIVTCLVRERIQDEELMLSNDQEAVFKIRNWSQLNAYDKMIQDFSLEIFRIHEQFLSEGFKP